MDLIVLKTQKENSKSIFCLSVSQTQPVYENESKQIRCLNAQTLTCCPYNQRTVLIVCSKYWQVSSHNALQQYLYTCTYIVLQHFFFNVKKIIFALSEVCENHIFMQSLILLLFM